MVFYFNVHDTLKHHKILHYLTATMLYDHNGVHMRSFLATSDVISYSYRHNAGHKGTYVRAVIVTLKPLKSSKTI